MTIILDKPFGAVESALWDALKALNATRNLRASAQQIADAYAKADQRAGDYETMEAPARRLLRDIAGALPSMGLCLTDSDDAVIPLREKVGRTEPAEYADRARVLAHIAERAAAAVREHAPPDETDDMTPRERLSLALRSLGHGGIAEVARRGGVDRRGLERKRDGERPVSAWDVYAVESIAAEILSERT